MLSGNEPFLCRLFRLFPNTLTQRVPFNSIYDPRCITSYTQTDAAVSAIARLSKKVRLQELAYMASKTNPHLSGADKPSTGEMGRCVQAGEQDVNPVISNRLSFNSALNRVAGTEANSKRSKDIADHANLNIKLASEASDDIGPGQPEHDHPSMNENLLSGSNTLDLSTGVCRTDHEAATFPKGEVGEKLRNRFQIGNDDIERPALPQAVRLQYPLPGARFRAPKSMKRRKRIKPAYKEWRASSPRDPVEVMNLEEWQRLRLSERSRVAGMREQKASR